MFIRLTLFLLVGLISIILLLRLLTGWYAQSRLVGLEQAPKTPVAIVFGAGLRRDGGLTPVLQDRVVSAVELYLAGKVQKLLMSGDNRSIYYNEPGAMGDYAMKRGVLKEDIVLDYAGWRTYDTCYRARDIFGVKEAILVTQGYHLPRALYICNTLEISAVGLPSDGRTYRTRSLFYWNVREILATLAAFWDVHISRPTPILGEPEPIFDLPPDLQAE